MAKKQTHKKRYGHHQKQTNQFLKTYWPYMPLALIISAMLALSVGMHKVGSGVLSYATNISSQSLLDATNQQRLSNHKMSLQLNNKLSAAAQAKANDMAARNYWAHNTPDGSPPWIFFEKAGYSYQKAGENLAYGFINSTDAITGWMNSPTHRENLLDGAFQDVGFGFANVADYQGKGPETVIVAEYGLPGTAFAASSAPGISLNTTFTNNVHTLGVANNNVEPASRTIAVSQLLSSGRIPGINLLIVISALFGLGILLIKHSLALRRIWLKGERFALHHPLFDITILSFIGLCVMLLQSSGTIR